MYPTRRSPLALAEGRRARRVFGVWGLSPVSAGGAGHAHAALARCLTALPAALVTAPSFPPTVAPHCGHWGLHSCCATPCGSLPLAPALHALPRTLRACMLRCCTFLHFCPAQGHAAHLGPRSAEPVHERHLAQARGRPLPCGFPAHPVFCILYSVYPPSQCCPPLTLFWINSAAKFMWEWIVLWRMAPAHSQDLCWWRNTAHYLAVVGICVIVYEFVLNCRTHHFSPQARRLPCSLMVRISASHAGTSNISKY